MATYEVRVRRPVRRELESLPARDQSRIYTAMAALAGEPRPPGCKKLQGEPDLYRIRVGIYRVLYRIRDQLLIVIVVRVRHRRDAYRLPHPPASEER